MCNKCKKLKKKLVYIQRWALDGVYTDGAHHKQEYLDAILREIMKPEELQMYKDQYGDWEED